MFNRSLIEKYNRPGPRYTSYPTALQFSEAVDRQGLSREVADGSGPLSVYVHLPFCEKQCWFCGCNTIITRSQGRADHYLDVLEKEIAGFAQLAGGRNALNARRVNQLHFGGGTPNFLTVPQIERLGAILHKVFSFTPDAECGVELAPAHLEEEQVAAFAAIGMNRASFGVQDCNPEVQAAINRPQSPEQNESTRRWLREQGFGSINIDLIYGLPLQTTQSFRETVDAVAALEPNRLAVFNYAHVPWIKPAQKMLDRVPRPEAAEKLRILEMMVGRLEEHGYHYIGMDHFARPDDELAIAQQEKTLQRNFQGYSTCAGSEIASFGVSSISQTEGSYRQNHKDLKQWEAAVEEAGLPVERGLLLTDEDRLRRAAIMTLMCDLEIDYTRFAEQWQVDFSSHFAQSLEAMQEMQTDGLVEIDSAGLRVTDSGRFLLRNIAMCLDAYLPQGSAAEGRFSKTV